MFLRQDKKKTGRTYLTIIESYRDKNGISRSKLVESIGYLDVLEKEMDDPIAYYTAYAKKLDEEKKAENVYNFRISADECVNRDGTNKKNYGYIILR